MPIAPLQPVNYRGPTVPVPSLVTQEPEEGRMVVGLEINWDAEGGANKSVAVQLQDDGQVPIRQIRSLIVDNSLCAQAVQISFQDGDVLTIPASAKRVAVGVYTNLIDFVVLALVAPAAASVTRIQVLNYPIPPVVIL